MPARTLRRPWKTANRWADTPPITQNCSFLHHSSITTPLHLISNMPVAKMERKRDMNQILAMLLICSKKKTAHHKRQIRAFNLSGNVKKYQMNLVKIMFYYKLLPSALVKDANIPLKSDGNKKLSLQLSY
jgi:hypothetical protein